MSMTAAPSEKPPSTNLVPGQFAVMSLTRLLASTTPSAIPNQLRVAG